MSATVAVCRSNTAARAHDIAAAIAQTLSAIPSRKDTLECRFVARARLTDRMESRVRFNAVAGNVPAPPRPMVPIAIFSLGPATPLLAGERMPKVRLLRLNSGQTAG